MSTKLTDLGETNNNNISDLAFDENERRGTPIQEFYAGQKIFITGIVASTKINKNVPTKLSLPFAFSSLSHSFFLQVEQAF